MAQTVGAAVVELLMDRSRFDRELKGLQSLKIEPIKLDFKADTSKLKAQVQRELSGLQIPVAATAPRSSSGGGGSRGSNPALDRISATNAAEEAAIRKQQGDRLAIVQNSLKQEVVDSKGAQELIQKINIDTSKQLIREYDRRLSALKEAQSQGLISEKQAAQQTLTIQKQIASEQGKLARNRTQLASNRENAIATPAGIDLGANSKSITDLSSTLNKSYGDAQKFANGLGLTAEQANNAVGRLRELDRAGATNSEKFSALNKELGISATQFNQLSVAALQTKEGLAGIAAGAAAVGAAIAAAFVKGTQDFVEFDRAIVQSGVIGGSTGTPGLTALREEVQRLGIETTKAPAEIARMSVELSRAGFSAKETSSALEGIVRASEASGDNLVVVGDIIAKTIRTYGLSATQTGEVADALTATANATNSSISGLGESLSYVGSVAKSSNQPLDDTLVLLGLLGDAGIQGSNAGTSLSAALERLKIASAGGATEFTDLVKGSKRATEAFNIIGAEVRNADGSMKSILEVLPVIQQNLDGLSQTDKDVLFKALFGVEGGRAFQTLLNVTPDRLALVTDQIKNSKGAAEEAGVAMTTGLGGALSILGGSLQTLSVEVGSFVAVGLEPLVRASTALLGSFLSLPAPIKALVLGTVALSGAIAAATAALVAYNLVNGKFIVQTTLATAAQVKDTIATGALTTAKTALALATGTATAATKAPALSFVTMAAKAGLVVGAIAAVNLALSRLKDGGQSAKESANTVKQALLDLQLEAGKTKEDIESTLPKEPPPTDFVDGIVKKFADLNRASNRLIGLPENFLTPSTDAEKQLRDLRVGVLQVRDSMNAVIDTSRDFKGSQEEAAKIQEVFNTGIAEAQKQLNELSSSKIGTDAYEELKASLEGTIKQLNDSKAAFERNNGLAPTTAAAQQAIADATEQNTEAIAAQAKALSDLNDSYSANQAALEAANTLQQAAIEDSVSRGGKTEEQGRIASLNAERGYLSDRLKLNQQKLSELRDLQRRATDPEQVAELGKQIADLESEITKNRADIVKQGADRRVEIERQALEQIEKANQLASDRLEQAQTDQIIQIRRLQQARRLTAEQADAQITQVQQRALNEQVAQVEEQQKQIAELRSRGTISEEEANSRQMELQGQLGELNLQRIEGEIAALQELRSIKINALNEELSLSQQVAQVAQARGQIALTSISGQNSLLSSQSDLLRSQTDLTQQRLQFALDEAEAQGRTYDAEQLRLDIIDGQIAAQNQQNAIANEQLDLKYQQLEIETRQQQIASAIAIQEAAIAVQTAEINGLDQDRIDGLNQILQLRREERAAIDQSAEASRRALDLDRAAAQNQQQQNREALAEQRRREAQNSRSAAGSSGSSGGAGGIGGSGGSGGSGGGKGLNLNFTRIDEPRLLEQATKVVNAGSTEKILEALRLNSDNQNKYLRDVLALNRPDALKLDQLNQLAAGSTQQLQVQQQSNAIARAIDQGLITSDQASSKLDELIAAVKQASPSINVQAVDPLNSLGPILQELSANRARGAGI